MARIFSTTSTASQPQMTLDALMQRQRDLARSAPSANREMISPWQGAAYLGETLANVVQQRRADAALAEGRQGLAQAMSGVSMEEGPTADQIAQVSQYDPDLGMQLWKMSAEAVQARRQREQELADVASQRDWQRQQTTEGRIYEAGQEAARNQRELSEAEAVRKAEEEAQIRQEQRAATAAAAQPSTTQGKIVADFNKGAYGDPSTPDAQRLRDEALQAAARTGTGPATLSDKKLLIGEQDAFLNTAASAAALGRARDLLNQGIFTGYTGGLQTMAANAELAGDKEMANRTKEYNSIMNQEAIAAMSQALKGATTDTEMAQFITNMNDPTVDPSVKARQIDAMLAKVDAFQQLRGGRIQEWGGSVPSYANPYAAAPTDALPEGVSEEDIQETMRAMGMTREQVLERLRQGG
jgi:hypothetical protein